jgi:hypothetical protein
VAHARLDVCCIRLRAGKVTGLPISVGNLTVAGVDRRSMFLSARRVARVVFSAVWRSLVTAARTPASALLTAGYHLAMEV